MRKSLSFVLIAIFIATTAFIVHSAERNEVRQPKQLRARMMGQSYNMMPHGLGKLFEVAEKLELTNPQLLQLRMFHQKQAKHAEELKQKWMSEKKHFTADVKEEDVKKFAAEQAKMVETSILAKFQMQQELKKIFTPEQLKKLELMQNKDSKREGMRFFQGGDKNMSPMQHRRHMRKGMKPGKDPIFRLRLTTAWMKSKKLKRLSIS